MGRSENLQRRGMLGWVDKPMMVHFGCRRLDFVFIRYAYLFAVLIPNLQYLSAAETQCQRNRGKLLHTGTISSN